MISAGDGEAFDYVPLSLHPDGVDVDEVFRRANEFMSAVLDEDPPDEIGAMVQRMRVSMRAQDAAREVALAERDEPDSRKLIVKALVSQSLADHLGDVRDAEDHLWKALGVPPLPSGHPLEYTDSVYRSTRARLLEAGLADLMPDYAIEEEGEES